MNTRRSRLVVALASLALLWACYPIAETSYSNPQEFGTGQWLIEFKTGETKAHMEMRYQRQSGLAGLLEIPGVGKALAGKIVELVQTGTFDAWERLTAETPATVLDLLELPGVGPKTAATLHQKFKIASLDDLRKFAEGGGLEMVDGIGPKSAERIKASLARTSNRG